MLAVVFGIFTQSSGLNVVPKLCVWRVVYFAGGWLLFNMLQVLGGFYGECYYIKPPLERRDIIP